MGLKVKLVVTCAARQLELKIQFFLKAVSKTIATVLRDSLLLLPPPCFYIAKCNKRECCCIWLSGPGFQDLDKRTLGFSTSTDARTQQANVYIRLATPKSPKFTNSTNQNLNERLERWFETLAAAAASVAAISPAAPNSDSAAVAAISPAPPNSDSGLESSTIDCFSKLLLNSLPLVSHVTSIPVWNPALQLTCEKYY